MRHQRPGAGVAFTRELLLSGSRAITRPRPKRISLRDRLQHERASLGLRLFYSWAHTFFAHGRRLQSPDKYQQSEPVRSLQFRSAPQENSGLVALVQLIRHEFRLARPHAELQQRDTDPGKFSSTDIYWTRTRCWLRA